MKQVFKYDANGIFVESVMLNNDERIPEDCTDVQLPSGLFQAKFINGEWVEGLSQEEIDAIKNAPQPLSEVEELKAQHINLVFELMMNGVL